MCTGMAADILGNQPQNHPHGFPRALWVEGEMRVSQVSKDPFGATFKTESGHP